MSGKLIFHQFIVLITGVILLGQIQCQFLLFPDPSNAPKNSQPGSNQENEAVSISNGDLPESVKNKSLILKYIRFLLIFAALFY